MCPKSSRDQMAYRRRRAAARRCCQSPVTYRRRRAAARRCCQSPVTYRRRRAAARRCCRLNVGTGWDRAICSGSYQPVMTRAAATTSRIFCDPSRSAGESSISSMSSRAARTNRSSTDPNAGRAAARAAASSAAWRALARLRDAAARHAGEQYFARRPRGSSRGGIGPPHCAHSALSLLMPPHFNERSLKTSDNDTASNGAGHRPQRSRR